MPVPDRGKDVRLSQLHDFHFATWVLIESDSINQVNRWAAERVDEPAVKEFARASIEAHDRLLEQLQGPLAASFQQDDARVKGSFDFGAMLQEVGKRLRDQPPNEPQPAAPLVEGPGQPASSASNPAPAAQPAARPRERRLARRQPDATRDENVRRRREAVETLRVNLPRLLDELGESVDAADLDSENVGLAFIELKRQLGERYAASMIKELGQGPPQDITPGYLGIQLVSNLQLINTMTVAQQHASPELQGLLKQGIEDARRRVQQARQLMAETSSRNLPRLCAPQSLERVPT